MDVFDTNLSNTAWNNGKAAYMAGVGYEDNPYLGFDEELANDWLEGYQMASYQERQETTKSIN